MFSFLHCPGAQITSTSIKLPLYVDFVVAVSRSREGEEGGEDAVDTGGGGEAKRGEGGVDAGCTGPCCSPASRVPTHCPSYQLLLPLLLLPHKTSAEMMKDLLMGDQNLSFNKCVVGSIGKTSSSITEKFRLTGTGLPNTSRKLSCAIKDLCHGQVELKLHLLTSYLSRTVCISCIQKLPGWSLYIVVVSVWSFCKKGF